MKKKVIYIAPHRPKDSYNPCEKSRLKYRARTCRNTLRYTRFNHKCIIVAADDGGGYQMHKKRFAFDSKKRTSGENQQCVLGYDAENKNV